MYNKLKILLYLEYINQSRQHSIIKYLIVYFIIFITTSTLTIDDGKIATIIFPIIFFPMALMGFNHIIIKPDLNNGFLEHILTCYQPITIIICKFLVCCFATIGSLIIIIPLILILYHLDDIKLISIVSSCLLLLSVFSSSLLVLVATIQCYFRTNNNLISSLILLLILPHLMLCSFVIYDPNNLFLLNILFGINLIMVPVILLLSAYLLKNIYHINY